MFHEHDINSTASSWPQCARACHFAALDVCQFKKGAIRLVCAAAPESIWSNVRASTSPFLAHDTLTASSHGGNTALHLHHSFIAFMQNHATSSLAPLLPSVRPQISARRSPSAQIHNHGIQVLQVYIYRALPILSDLVVEADDQTAPRSAFPLAWPPLGGPLVVPARAGSRSSYDQDLG